MSENVKPWSPGYRSETVQTAKMCDSLVQSLPFKGPSNLAEWLGWFSGLMAPGYRFLAEHIFAHFFVVLISVPCTLLCSYKICIIVG